MDTCKQLLFPLSLLAASAVSAHLQPLSSPLSALAGEAELVFQGTVVDVQYQTSLEGLPHTFVTYQIEDVLKGQYRDKTITLRFIGGVKQEGDKLRRLQVTGVPEFAKGAQDLLLVSGNEQRICPLVHCAEGRFRLEGGYVSDGAGNTLGRDSKGAIRFAPNPNKMSAPEPSGDHGLIASPTETAAPLSPLDPVSFVAHVRDVLAQQPAGTLTPVSSADRSKPFTGPQAKAEAAPRQASSVMPIRTDKATAFDRWEAEALERNGGNPVVTVPSSLQR